MAGPNGGSSGNSASTQTTTQTISLPAGLLGGDIVLLNLVAVTLTATPAGISSVTSSGPTQPVQLSNSPKTGSEGLPASVTVAVYKVKAAGSIGSASSDASATITITWNVSAFLAQDVEAYTGFSDVDVVNGAFGGANSGTVTLPTLLTGFDNEWAIFTGGGAAEGSTLVGPSGSTQRQGTTSSANIAALICDSNGSVGPTATSIGGGTFFTDNSGTNSVLAGFTIGLAPLSTAVSFVVPLVRPPGRRSPMAFQSFQPVVQPLPGVVQTFASLSGTGSLGTAPDFEEQTTLSGVGSLATTPRFEETATLSGVGSLTSSPVVAETAALSSIGSLVSVEQIGLLASLSGVGTLSGSPAFAEIATLSGVGTLKLALSLQATMSGIGTLSGTEGGAGIATLTGLGILTSNPILTELATLFGLSNLNSAPIRAEVAALSGLGNLIAADQFAATKTLTGISSLVSSPILAESATLSGLGTLAANSALVGVATMSGVGKLNVVVPGTQGSATLTGIGSLIGVYAFGPTLPELDCIVKTVNKLDLTISSIGTLDSNLANIGRLDSGLVVVGRLDTTVVSINGLDSSIERI